MLISMSLLTHGLLQHENIVFYFPPYSQIRNSRCQPQFYTRSRSKSKTKLPSKDWNIFL